MGYFKALKRIWKAHPLCAVEIVVVHASLIGFGFAGGIFYMRIWG